MMVRHMLAAASAMSQIAPLSVHVLLLPLRYLLVRQRASASAPHDFKILLTNQSGKKSRLGFSHVIQQKKCAGSDH
jgi:hypothetical protein